MNRSLMKSILRGDRAENSIMQTISIAVSAILIAGGTMGAPGMIMKARETAAKTTIATIATAQASYIAKKGGYTNRLSQLNSSFMGNALDLSLCGPIPTPTATDNCAAINVITGFNLAEGSSCYLTFEKTAAGKVYFIQSKGLSGASGTVEIPQPWPSTAKAMKVGGNTSVSSDLVIDFGDPTKGFDASCATGGVWPTSLAAAMTKQAMVP